MEALYNIFNDSGQVLLLTPNTITFNAVDGDVGSAASPILVQTGGQIVAGAYDTASFNGISVDDTVNDLPSNPPCIVIFNGVILRQCVRPSPNTLSSAQYFALLSPFYNDLNNDQNFTPGVLNLNNIDHDVALWVANQPTPSKTSALSLEQELSTHWRVPLKMDKQWMIHIHPLKKPQAKVKFDLSTP